ncbi:MAG TPA: MBL fold metallo-hydrolase [Candidatus Saccharimonadales bacterium]|nr:MBL fold metallo-hydrolase [Candidatus Saccharimonadales bacterium]
MTITKYPQSCLKIEKDGRTLLVDVGTLATAEFGLKDFGHFDAVLFTHSHPDHFDPKFLPQLIKAGATLYGNGDVAARADGSKVELVDDNEELVVAGFKIKAHPMEHCLMTDGSPAGIPNTGYLLDDHLLLPGDSTEDVGIKAKVVAIPIFGPDISPHDAFKQSTDTEAEIVIPVHYDVAQINPDVFKIFAGLGSESLKAKIHTLENGESIQV